MISESDKSRIGYLENIMKQMVDTLKGKNILDQEVVFLTEDERLADCESTIERFTSGG